MRTVKVVLARLSTLGDCNDLPSAHWRWIFIQLGGPLASEVYEQMLADKDIDAITREKLFDSGGMFETVMADLQVSKSPDDQKRAEDLLTSVVGIFNNMNNSFMYKQFEFENPPSVQHSVTAFLGRFHAIYTLNQDSLLELHYNPHFGTPQNWSRLYHPGLRFPSTFRPSGARQDKFAIMEPNPPFTSSIPTHGAQPYIKLHGSVNWVESSAGKRILIMGGEKHWAAPYSAMVPQAVPRNATPRFN
jgi:hypothetical protein